MHRLQISLPATELQFLRARAERDGLSMAEVIRQLVRREAEANAAGANVESVWEIAGIADDNRPLLEGAAVSERPDLYLAAAVEAPRRRRRARPHAAQRRRVKK